MAFVDRVTVEVEAGKGGDGCVSFRREKYVPRGGPDGGDGGDGGSVIVIAEQGVDSLSTLVHRKHWRAASGAPGTGSGRHGAKAQDLTILVPPGTVLIDAEGDFVLKDLSEPGATVVAARGGAGGKGNCRFKSSTNQAPREFTRGGAAEKRRITFELKVIADVGLLGKPNAGKSTLLSRVSRARPEIADYPFTTKIPNLGIVQIDMDRTLVMADIPGLIEGAHAGAGLGHEFLRHVERTRVLVHLVEPSPTDGTDPLENYRTIRGELEQYSADLAARPELIAVSKGELPGAEEVREKLAEETGREVMLFSSVTGQGLNALMTRTYAMLQEARQTEAEAAKPTPAI
jgi:GTP-binding protein